MTQPLFVEMAFPGYEWVMLSREAEDGVTHEMRLAIFRKSDGTYATVSQALYDTLKREGYRGLEQIPEACLVDVIR